MISSDPFSVAVLVATAHRPQLLGQRALASIGHQTRPPNRVVIVDDSNSAAACELTDDTVRSWRPDEDVELLRNRRSRGASGAWNTGLDQLLRTCGDPARIYVAILDDDDCWETEHLASCFGLARRRDLDLVAAPFLRITEGETPETVFPPERLDAADFLVGNPGIQASNLVCRLSVLLEAGLFDEALPSCTDRDLCIRIAELPGIRYAGTSHPTVRHYACRSRLRLSTPGSAPRLAGLDRFFRKYRGRMNDAERARFRNRAGALFDWREKPFEPLGPRDDSDLPEAWQCVGAAGQPVHLIVGTITGDGRLENLRGLLEDLRKLGGDPGLSGLDVLVLENGDWAGGGSGFRALVERERAQELRIYPIYREAWAEDSAGQLPIASARSELQAHLYAFARRRPGAVVWILDDDMRLDPLTAGEDGLLRRRRQALVPALQALRRRHAKGDADIAIGAYSGAPPLPFGASVRVQLVDLAASLQWFAALDPEHELPERSAENAAQRSGRRDWYYDLSRNETDRLETPFWATQEFPGERVGEAFARLAATAERILAGEQLFRPLAAETVDAEPARAELRRGGNTFVLDIETLRRAPNQAPVVDGRPGRRSDMVWTLLQQRYFGKRTVAAPIAIYHDRGHAPAIAPDLERIVDDIRGHAVLAALEDSPEALVALDNAEIEAVACEIDDFVRRAQERLEDRLAAFRLSFHRVRGLARVVRALADDERAWWADEDWRDPAGRLRTFADLVSNRYGLDSLARVERGARTLDGTAIRAFLEGLPGAVAAHRDRIDTFLAAPPLEDERVANAMAVAKALTTPAGPLSVLGSGAEGVALADGERVFKVFDYWKPRDGAATRSYLRSLPGSWTGARSLYPIQAFHESGHRAVLVYPFEPSEPYAGRHGPGLVDLLVDCRRFGVVCRNLHPDNLRVAGGRVRLIDYGADLRPLEDEDDFTAMCRRAWLCWRWAERSDLKAIMRRALDDAGIPELDGFDRFHEAVRRAAGLGLPVVDIVLDLAGNARNALDYGCGNGELAQELAGRGMAVLGYDPDGVYRPRWEQRCRETVGLRFTADRDAVTAAGPFQLVVCRRVFCTIPDDRVMRTILDDLRTLVSDGGRVVVSVCDPHFTFGGTSAEAERELPMGARYEDSFSWRKTVRATGRVRCDVHRPERILRREFARVGLAICDRREALSVDLERFEPFSDHLAFALRPLAPLPGEVSLVIRACAMEADTLEVQVPHLVSQLESPRAFAERILVVDRYEGPFLRQHSRGDPERLHTAAQRLVEDGWIDRIVEAPGDGDATALHCRWFGIAASRTHTVSGAPVAMTLAGFDACGTRYVLHVDADVMIGRLDRDHDYLADMLGVLTANPAALTAAMNVATDRDRPWTDRGETGAWRVESRAGMVDLARLRGARPLPNRLVGDRPALTWHRALDPAIARGVGTSWRGGNRQTFHVHPLNDRKGDREQWFMALDRIEHGVVPALQHGRVEWAGGPEDWMGPPRCEPFVFIVSGRNVEPGRFRRCLASIMRQKGPCWGAVLFDDASVPRIAEHFEVACQTLGPRCTVIRNRRRRGLLANMVTAIRMICTDPETVIVTLDADDALIGDQVLERLAPEYARGADVTVGSMLRTDKASDYPVEFAEPRRKRGGNVWQHLRSFRKRLFDAIPDDALRLDGDYVDIANDWAFMLPIVEMAENPVHIAEALYLHEPSEAGKEGNRAEREATIGRVLDKRPVVIATPADA